MKKILLTAVACLIGMAAMAQGAKMPGNITIKGLDGQSVQSSTIQNDGKPMIISFWATWCKPCNRELDAIKEVYEEWQEETGVKLVAISIDDTKTAARVRPWVDGKDWPFEVYLDQNKDFARAMNVVNVPHTFLINGEGEIVWQHTSYQDGGEEELIEKVRELMKSEE
ncbi:MAG: TlpA family protein disulfide reductase [Bacteroidales bacterium]|nr:TlpA family protein disulfide reductase [Bacteroidales bacterium]